MARKVVILSPKVHAAVKREARRSGMLLQPFAERLLESALRQHSAARGLASVEAQPTAQEGQG